jgi:hypothetical protein
MLSMTLCRELSHIPDPRCMGDELMFEKSTNSSEARRVDKLTIKE